MWMEAVMGPIRGDSSESAWRKRKELRINGEKFWVFGLCPSSGILKTRENVSGTGSVSVLR
jgi:hypothetical protein